MSTSLLPAEVFKDVNSQDFNRYFQGTMLAWKLSPTKIRLWQCLGVGNLPKNRVAGMYLTRSKEWKTREVAWEDWWEDLFIIPPKMIAFNLATIAGVWIPSHHTNFKKSIHNNTGIGKLHLYGQEQAANMTSNVVWQRMFPDLYGLSIPQYTVEEAVSGSRASTFTRGKFVVDNRNRQILYFTNDIGSIKGNGNIVLHEEKKYMKEYLAEEGGFPLDKIETQ